MARQLRLPLQRPTSHSREDFTVSGSNRAAVDLVEAWPKWPGGALALVGPAESGKSHLARIWAEKAGATVLQPGASIEAIQGAVLVEEADAFGDEELVFHLLNRGLVGGGLLLTSRLRPLAWPAALPDLRSRLNALTVAELSEPDDPLLAEVILKLFRERNIRPTDDVLPFLLRRIERSVPAARDLVALIDETAAAQGREISRVLVRQILEIGAETPDLFE